MVVIGSGPAGEKAAAQAAYFGHRVAVVERAPEPGGVPVHSGGIPSKTLREAANYLTGFRYRDIYGLGLGLSPDLMLERLRTREAEVEAMMTATVRHNLDRHGIELIHGDAVLGAPGSVTVTGPDGAPRSLTTDVVLIATGSRPLRPRAIPFDDPDVHDSDAILAIDRIPASLVVIGGGPVGSEYASIFTALGAAVTLVDAAPRLVPFLDPEISELLAESFAEHGMDIHLGSSGAAVERRDGALQVDLGDGSTATPDMVLFAAGRVGNTDGLGLDGVGVDLDDRGRIIVNEHFQTTAGRIYAAGDVIGPPALASVSAEQGRVAACHAFDIPFKETVDRLPPYGIYSIPEVGMIGLTEPAAQEQGLNYVVGRASFAANPKSRIAGTTTGIIKLVVDRDSRRLLGVHILGEEAAELIHHAQAVMHAGEPFDRFIDFTYNIPTRTEAYKYAAYDVLGRWDAARGK
ncbi:MAG TPA: Si-specific NAD(P)(+) transhydrogenase [Acidimicrobiia bacterium]|jgi:NAD(P) transhydrogenase|nr:Si-specific NAD(P)(+) transhydrogenase [Acidimicrobiia bacterium]